jgi:hypothetical protein
MSDRILLSEWAGPDTGVGLLGAGWDRSPCPVCGHPTGDCTHDVPGGHAIMSTPSTEKSTGKVESKTAKAQVQAVEEQINQDPTDVGLNEGRTRVGDAQVVKEDETVSSSVYEITDTTEMVTLQRDLVEEFFYPDTKRPSYRILYTKGQTVSRAAIEAYNAGVEAANKLRENGGVDPANPAGIDSTTIASGTRVPALDSLPGDDSK